MPWDLRRICTARGVILMERATDLHCRYTAGARLYHHFAFSLSRNPAAQLVQVTILADAL
jgi:hypothetical protein